MKAFVVGRGISILIQLCLGLSGAGALTVTIPQPKYEFTRGDNVILPCTFRTRLTNPPSVTISWLAYAVDDKTATRTSIITYYHPAKHTDIKEEYEGRVSLDVDVSTGKANLKLTSITLKDNKKFECRLLVAGDNEGTPFASTRLVVLGVGKPICSIQGKAEYGQNINLTCLSEEGSPPPTYTWSSKDVSGKPRPLDPRSTQKGGVLSLFNVSKDTSGYFSCVSRNKIHSDTCNITLTVMPPSMNIGSTTGIIGGVVAGLIVLIIIIYCCCLRHKKKKEEEYAMGVREDDYYDQESHPEKQETTRSNGDSKRPDDGSERDYDRRSNCDDRHDDDDCRHSERRDPQYADNDLYIEPDDNRDRDKPPVPPNKPPKRDYDD